MENIKTFEKYSMDYDNDIILEGKIGDFFKSAGDKVLDALAKLNGTSVQDTLEKWMKNKGVLQSLVNKADGATGQDLINAFEAGKKVKFAADKIEDEKARNNFKFIWGLAKTSYDKATATSGGQFGK